MTGRLGPILSRPIIVTLAALGIVVVLAWAWLLAGAGLEMNPGPHSMPDTDYGHGSSAPMAMDGGLWTSGRLALTFAMWWVMMVAMMVPSAAPVILLYARATAGQGGQPAAASFVGGYLGIWAMFSGGATALQIGLTQAGLLSGHWMRSENMVLTAALLIVTGLYQLSPAKAGCLRHCQNPAQVISRYYRDGRLGAARMGAIHGAFCVGCCWSLMALLFVGGVMNLAWIAALTLLVAAEKLLPFGRLFPLVSGVALVIAGLGLIAGSSGF